MNEISETGVRGFLKWLSVAQPDIYKKAAPIIAQKAPEAFSDFHAGGWRTAGMDHAAAVKKLGYIGDTSPIDFSQALNAPIQISASDISLPNMPNVDVSTAANSGSASSSTTDLIGSIVSGISSLYLGKKQADIQQQVVNTQLQRAALGLPPLPSSLANLGVPQVSLGLSSGTSALAIAAGVGFLALIFFGRRSRG